MSNSPRIAKNFETHLQIELNNITLPGERGGRGPCAACERATSGWGTSFATPPSESRTATTLYFAALATFNEMKREANNVLDMNQKNMEEETRPRIACGDLCRFG